MTGRVRKLAGWVGLAALLSSCLACARDPRVAAAERLSAGIEALTGGRAAEALEACRAAGRVLADNASAHRCRLVAALREHDWESAQEAVETLQEQHPDDAWYQAVQVELSRRQAHPREFELQLDDVDLAWACIDARCRFDPSGEDATSPVPPYLAALLAHGAGDDARATALAAPGSEEDSSSRRALHRLLLLGSDRAALRAVLAEEGCGADTVQLDASLAAFLGLAPDRLPGCPAPAGAAPDPSERAQAAQAAVALQPESATANLAAGIAVLAAGQTHAALFYLETAARYSEAGVVARLYLYLGALLAGELDRARRLLADLQSSLPPEWHNWLQSLGPEFLL